MLQHPTSGTTNMTIGLNQTTEAIPSISSTNGDPISKNVAPNGTSADISGSSIIFILVGAFAGIAIALLLAAKFVKHPKIHSKFGRKNSFGTLNTVNTQQSNH